MAQRTGFEENLDARAMEEDGDESALDEREATDFQGREELEQRTSRSEVSDLMMLMKAQLLTAEKREERLDEMLKTVVSATAAQPPAAVMKLKQISAERPVLLSPQVWRNFLRGKSHCMHARGVSTAGSSKSRNEGECSEVVV